MRIMARAIALSPVVLICTGVSASIQADNQRALAALQSRAEQAEPRDRCFLYAQLVNRLTDLAGQQFNSGDSVQASETLKQVQRYAQEIRSGIGDDTNKLNDSELILSRTMFLLQELLHEASYEDRPALESTIRLLDQVRTKLLIQVFAK